MSNGGRSSRGSSPQSTFGHARSAVGTNNDRLIKHLKNEVNTLKKNSKGLSETTARLTNMRHKYQIILGEKVRDEESHRQKEQHQEIELNAMADDQKLSKQRLTHKEEEVNELRSAYLKLEHNVTTKEELIAQLDKELAVEYGQLQAFSQDRGVLESNNSQVSKQQAESSVYADSLARDLQALNEQVTKRKRTLKEHKSVLQELKAKTFEVQGEIYKVEEDLKNMAVHHRSKENQLNRLEEKTKLIESDIHLLDAERDNLRDCMLSKDDTLKCLAETKAEHMRRETALTRDTLTIDQTLEDTDKELARRREELADQEHGKLTAQTELKSLKSLYDRLISDNRKLVDGLRHVAEEDDRAARGLEREDKIHHIITEANRELEAAVRVVRD